MSLIRLDLEKQGEWVVGWRGMGVLDTPDTEIGQQVAQHTEIIMLVLRNKTLRLTRPHIMYFITRIQKEDGNRELKGADQILELGRR